MDKRLEKYLQTVESELRGLPEQQRELELREMRQHLEAIVARLQEGGLSREEAVEAAIAQFGAARKVGSELRRADEAKEPLWRILLVPVGGLACDCALHLLLHPVQGWLSYDIGSGRTFIPTASILLLGVLGWLATLLSGVVAGYLSPRWGGRLLLGLKLLQIATIVPFLTPNVFWLQLLSMLLIRSSSVLLGSHLGSRLAHKRRNTRVAGPTEVA